MVMLELPEDEISFKEALVVLRKYARWAVLTALVLGAVIFALSGLLPPRYESSLRLVASQGILTPVTLSLPQMALNLDGKAFSEAAMSRGVRQEALRKAFPDRNMSLEESERVYRSDVRLKEGRNSVVLTLRVRAPSPEEAQALAEAWGEVLLLWDQKRVRQAFTQYRVSLEAQASALEAQLQDPTLGSQDRLNYQTALANTMRDLHLARALEVTASGQLGLLDPASPAAKVFPRPLLFGGVSGILGGVLVLLLGFIRESLDQSLRSAEEAYRLTGLPVLSEFPDLPPGSPVVESLAFKEAASYLRTSLNPHLVNEEKKTLLITSPLSEEGKTSVALALGQAYARSGKRTLLVDLDLRHPLLTKRVHALYPNLPPVRRGLEAFFQLPLDLPSPVPLEEDLWILPALGALENPSEALTKEFRTLYRFLEEGPYEVIIFDVAPLLFPDSLVVAPHVSGTLLVVAEAKTHRRALQEGLDTLKRIGARILGLVLNRVREGRFGQGRGDYRYPYRYSYGLRRRSGSP